jgi:hypothetical protein
MHFDLISLILSLPSLIFCWLGCSYLFLSLPLIHRLIRHRKFVASQLECLDAAMHFYLPIKCFTCSTSTFSFLNLALKVWLIHVYLYMEFWMLFIYTLMKPKHVCIFYLFILCIFYVYSILFIHSGPTDWRTAEASLFAMTCTTKEVIRYLEVTSQVM